MKILLVGNYNKVNYDRTKWFSINEENNLKAQYHDAYFKYKALKESLKVLDLYDQVQQEILSKYPELEDQDLIDNSLKMATPIEQLDLSIRLYNVLKYNNLRTIKQIYESDFKTIFSLRNLGRKSLLELIDKLNELDCINPAWETDMQKYMQKL